MTDPWTTLPPTWGAPIVSLLLSLEAQGKAGAVPPINAVLADLRLRLRSMDLDALANHFDAAMGGFAIAGVLASNLLDAKRRVAALAADDFSAADYTGESVPMEPWDAALRRLAVKKPLPVALSSAQWAMVPAEIKNRAQLSAGIESAAFLQHISDRVADRLSGIEQDSDEFVFRLRQAADDVGLPLGPLEKTGTIQDIRSLPRLRLIYETQNAQAAEYARRKADLDPDAMDLYPAYALERVESRLEPRPAAFWAERWMTAGESVGWQCASRTPRVALKTSPIWTALGELGPFGNPHPPFEWGSGMGTVDVSREQAEHFGLLAPGAQPPPSDEPGFNQDVSANVADIHPEIRTQLRQWFGDRVVERDGRMWLKE